MLNFLHEYFYFPKCLKIKKELSEYARQNANKLEIDYLEETDGGIYECSTPNGQFKRIKLVVKPTIQLKKFDNEDSNIDTKSLTSPDVSHKDLDESGAEIVKNIGEDVEINCGITEEFNEIQWNKKNSVIFNLFA
jgi:hypothetical protein